MSRVYTAIAVTFLWAFWCSAHAQDDADCGDWNAVAELVQGRAEILRAGEERWVPLVEGARACHGDSIRTYAFARVLFSVPGETSFKIDEDATVILAPPQDESRFWLNLIRGAVHIISRQRGAVRIVTPYWNAGLEGTEVLVSVDDAGALLSVYEGSAVLENDQGSIEVPGSFRVVADADSSGELLAAVRDELFWSLYYPTIIEGPLPGPDSTDGEGVAFSIVRAQSRMHVGRIPEAEDDLAAALSRDPGNADALALSAIVALMAGRSDAAILAANARASDPDSVPALLTQSYLLERDSEWLAARDVAQAAVGIDSTNALAMARLAELEFATGAYGEALEHAEQALRLNPDLAQAQIVRGFLAIAAGDRRSAREHFDNAVRLESAAPLARLGLSTIELRSRSVDDGRAEAENAVALQPNDSVIRAYGARAYAEEGRQSLAETQIALAKALDMSDSTAWIYEAINAYDSNRPIRAVANLDRAMELTQDVGPFRSTLTLDEDLGTRAAPYGGIYRSAGYPRGALLGGTYSVAAFPADFSAYRLLADAYSYGPRQQMTRVSASMQGKLRQPFSLTPDAPELLEADISLMARVGPAPLIHSEARSRYARKGFQGQVSAVAGNEDTAGEHVVGTYVGDTFSVNLGQFAFRTDGLRANNDFEHRIVDISAQMRPAIATNLLFDLRSVSTSYGDIDVLFDRSNFDPLIRQNDEANLLRVGAAHRISGSLDVLGLVTLANADFSATRQPLATVDYDADRIVSEFQLQHRLPRWNLTYGIRWSDGDDRAVFSSLIPGSMPPIYAEFEETPDHRHSLGYAYAHRQLGESLYLTLGVSVDRLEAPLQEVSEVNPKLGLVWRLGSDSFLRAAAFETTLGLLPSRQIVLPSLEPVHVAGFNQFFFGVEGERSRQLGVGFDHRFNSNWRLGVELRERKLTFPGILLGPFETIEFRMRETADEAGLYWTPREQLALSFAWQYEHFRNDGPADAIPEGYRFMRTNRLPVTATLFAGNSIRLELSGTYISQEGEFAFGPPGPSQSAMPAESEFAAYDVKFGYRMPNRLGSVELGVQNLTDEEFMYQDTDPYAPRLFYDRFFYSRFSLKF